MTDNRSSGSDDDTDSVQHQNENEDIKQLVAVAEKFRGQNSTVGPEAAKQLQNVCKRIEFERRMQVKMLDELENLKTILRVVDDSNEDANHRRRKQQASSVSALQKLQDHIEMAGWVEKESKYFKAWRRRWLVVRGANLIYFDSPSQINAGKPPRDCVPLDASDTKVTVYYQPMEKDPNMKRLVLSVEGNNHKIVFSANPQTIFRWRKAISLTISTINMLLHAKRSSHHPNTNITTALTVRKITDLELCGANNLLSSMDAVCVAQIVANRMQSLRQIVIESVSLDDSSCAVIASALFVNRNIESVSLANNVLTHASVGLLVDAVLAEGPFSPANAKATQQNSTSPSLSADPHQPDALLCLSLTQSGNNYNSNGDSLLCAPNPAPSKLHTLFLQNNPIGDEGALHACRLIKLHPNSPHVTQVSLRNTNMTPVGAEQLANAFSARVSQPQHQAQFPVLDLGENNLGDKFVANLCPSLSKLNTQKLFVDKSHITARGARDLFQFVTSNSNTLTHVNVNENDVDEMEAGRIFFSCLCQNVASNGGVNADCSDGESTGKLTSVVFGEKNALDCNAVALLKLVALSKA